MNIVEIVDKIFAPKEPSISDANRDKKRDLKYRQVLLDKIFEHFKERFEEESTDEDISYPVSFVIYLHPQDFKVREENFDKDVIASVTKFYRHINKHLANPNDDFLPDSSYWLFQFVNFEGLAFIEGRDGEILEVKKGEVVIVSSCRTTDFITDNVQSGGNVKSTYYPKGSAQNYDVSHESLLSMIDKLPNYKRRLKYFDDDRKKEKVTGKLVLPNSIQNTENEAYAILTCWEKFIGRDGSTGTQYFMVDKLISISGKDDMRNMARHIAKVNSDSVMDSHVQIKYIPETQQFKLAAFGNTKLNERVVELSSGGNIHWKDLSNNSDIFVNDEINIAFKKAKRE